MKLLEKYNRIKYENKGHIVLLKLGAFYISLGIDAYILSEVLKLKLTDISNSKKVGIPINSLKKYTNIMEDYDIPYVVVDEDKVVDILDGKFNFLYVNQKIEVLLNVFYLKDKVLQYICEYFSKNLGEML